MIKSALSIFKQTYTCRHKLLGHQCASFHRIQHEAKNLPRIITDDHTYDEIEYFSSKMKDLINTEQLDYFENVIKKVENINHPVADLMRVKLHNPMLDLIMLLVTKMVNEGKEITANQTSLSSAIQLIHIGNLIHQKGISDLHKMPNFGNSLNAEDDLIMGNKIALLAGDFLLANAQIRITKMRDADVLMIISRAMCDVVDASFVGKQDGNNNPLPYEPGRIPDRVDISFEESEKPVKLTGRSGKAEDEWMFRQILYRGYLIAKGCQSAAVLSGGGTQNVQKNCFELGKNLFLAWQAFVELKSFCDDIPIDGFNVSLISAPVLFHLNQEPSLYKQIYEESNSRDGLDHENLYTKVLNGPGMAETEKLLEKLKAQTHRELLNFSESEEKAEIQNILGDF